MRRHRGEEGRKESTATGAACLVFIICKRLGRRVAEKVMFQSTRILTRVMDSAVIKALRCIQSPTKCEMDRSIRWQ